MKLYYKTIYLLLALFLSSNSNYSQKLSEQANSKALSNYIEQLSEKVSKSVVKILVTSYGSEGAGNPRMAMVKGSGSGAIIESNGYIITNAHVVKGATKIKVKLSNKLREQNRGAKFLIPGETVNAQLVGINELTDIAVLKIEGENYPTLPFGNSDDLHQGKLVFAFGSPLGLENSVTMGIVSTKRRYLSDESPIAYIQTDAAINPGNSGGPLVNIDGEIVGINTMIISQSGGSDGIGFAIPSKGAMYVYNEIKKHGYLPLGTIGAMGQKITPILAEGLNISQDYGVIINDIIPGSPAEASGLKEGDVIISADGQPVIYFQDFTVAVYLKKENEKINFIVLRDGQRIKISTNVLEQPDASNILEQIGEIKDVYLKEIGLKCVVLNSTVRQILPGTRKSNGIIVTGVLAANSSWNEVIMPGDIIYSINKQPIYDIETLQKNVLELNEGSAVVIQVERAGRLVYLPFEVN